MEQCSIIAMRHETYKCMSFRILIMSDFSSFRSYFPFLSILVSATPRYASACAVCRRHYCVNRYRICFDHQSLMCTVFTEQLPCLGVFFLEIIHPKLFTWHSYTQHIFEILHICICLRIDNLFSMGITLQIVRHHQI